MAFGTYTQVAFGTYTQVAVGTYTQVAVGTYIQVAVGWFGQVSTRQGEMRQLWLGFVQSELVRPDSPESRTRNNDCRFFCMEVIFCPKPGLISTVCKVFGV